MSERPLSRRLVRLAAQLSGRAHRQDVWPFMTIDRTSDVVTWRGKPLLTLDKISDIVPSGADTLAVVGSGPSLAQQRMDALPPRTAILLNGAAQLAQDIIPLAIAVEDERFVFRHSAMLKAVPQSVPFLLSAAALRAVAERRPDILKDRRIALIDNLAKPVHGPRRKLDDPELDSIVLRDADAALSRNPDRGVVIVGTVAFSALQIAMAARPRQIVLAGIDLSNADAPRFYETAQDSAPSGIIAGLDRSLAGFALARDHALAESIALVCASSVSALLALGIPHSSILD